jgi:hypothetical protein
MNYYYSTDGIEVLGPYTLEELLDDYRSGALPKNTSVCAEGQKDWQPLRSLIQPHSQLRAPQSPPQSRQPNQSVGPYAAATMQQDEKPLFRTTIHKAIYAQACFGPSMHRHALFLSSL